MSEPNLRVDVYVMPSTIGSPVNHHISHFQETLKVHAARHMCYDSTNTTHADSLSCQDSGEFIFIHIWPPLRQSFA